MNVSEASGSGREKLELASPFHYCSVIHQCHVKENPDIKIQLTLTKMLKHTKTAKTARGL